MKTKLELFIVGMLLAAGLTCLGQPCITITTQPQNQTNAAGTTATLAVEATGAEPLVYQWQQAFDFYNFLDRPEGTNRTLVITNVQSLDSGNYRVIITNAECSVTSEVARLSVVSIVSQPTNFAVVSLGATVANRILLSGGATSTYQWRFNGTNMAGQTKSSIILTNLQLSNEGGYDVVVAYTGGSVISRVATLALDPTFTKITSGPHVTDLGTAINSSWGDYDKDGNVDLLVTRYGSSGKSQLYRNNGDGTFVTAATAFPVATDGWISAIIADFDNDTWPDLFAGNDQSPSRFQYNEAGQSFTSINCIISGSGWNVGAVDFDHDGFLDLYYTYGSAQNRLLRNQGGRVFKQMTVAETGELLRNNTFGGACWGDYDDDGWVDVYAPDRNGNRTYLLRNQGGRFTQVANIFTRTVMPALAGAWGDYDNDGRLDLAIACFGGNSAIYRNLGNGEFAAASIGVTISGQYNSAAWADYDNDGFLDLFMTCYSGANILLRNNGNGTLTHVSTGSIVIDRPITSSFSYNGIWFDANADGFLDLYVSNGNDAGTAQTANFFYLTNPNGNHWLEVRLKGTVSNSEGIGTKVRALASPGGNDKWQRRDITAGDGYNGNNLYAHFGLGDATSVTTLRVEWPSGIVQEFHDVAANQILTVVEHQDYAGAAPQIGGVTNSTGGLKLGISEPEAGARYILEASTNLVTWTKLMARTSAGVTTNYTDTRATNYTRRFYRLQVP